MTNHCTVLHRTRASAADAGFIAEWAPETARRQFNLSVALLAAMMLAATLLTLVVRQDPGLVRMTAVETVMEGRSGQLAVSPYGALVVAPR